MKTVFVVFCNSPKHISNKLKRYAFNVSGEVKVGDRILSPSYNTPMCIVEILDNWYNYINISTGELKDKVSSTFDHPIRTLKLVDNNNIIYGTLIRE